MTTVTMLSAVSGVGGAISGRTRLRGRGAVVALAAALVAPAAVRGDVGALTVEAGGAVSLGQVAPSVGQGDAVTGTLGGVWTTLRYAVRHRAELQLSGFWYAPATFTQLPVTISGNSGALAASVTRWGAAAGLRVIAAGLVWRVPVGLDVGWAHTRSSDRDLLAASGGSLGMKLGNASADQLLVAPFVGLEWQATDRLTFAVVPRLEILAGGASTLGVVVPLTVGWSWYLL